MNPDPVYGNPHAPGWHLVIATDTAAHHDQPIALDYATRADRANRRRNERRRRTRHAPTEAA